MFDARALRRNRGLNPRPHRRRQRALALERNSRLHLMRCEWQRRCPPELLPRQESREADAPSERRSLIHQYQQHAALGSA